MKLKDGQVELIEKELLERGITYDPIRDDLLDHICSAVEEQMENGVPFMEAYNSAIDRLSTSKRLHEINNETISILNVSTMLNSFLTTTFRILKKNPGYSTIKVLGLGIGLAVFFVSLLYVDYERGFDDFHADSDRIFRILRESENDKLATTAFPLVKTLRSEFPAYEFTTFFKNRSKTLFKKDNHAFNEDGLIWADQSFTSIFDFKEFQGDITTALIEPNSVVLTHDVALKYFGEVPELGEVLTMSWNDQDYPLKITGLIPEWPSNMHIQFDILVSFITGETAFPGGITDSWDMNYCYSYVKVPENTTGEQFTDLFQGFVTKHVRDESKPYTSFLGGLQPLTKIHLQPEVKSGYVDTIDPSYLTLALGIGVLVLLITAINFVTMTVAQYQERGKEIGIRKAIGASRNLVISQFAFETFIKVLFGLIIATAITIFSIGFINEWMGKSMELSIRSLGTLTYLVPITILLLTILTGVFPAISFSDASIYEQGKQKVSHHFFSTRKLLLACQFLIAACLIVISFIIFDQINYVQNKSLGYTKDQIIYLPYGRTIRYEPETFKNLAKQHPAVQEVTLSFYKPSDNFTNTISIWQNGDEPIDIAATSIDEDFFRTFDIPVIEGQAFKEGEMNLERVFMINESAQKHLGLKEPIGTFLNSEFRTGQPDMPIERRTGRIIGVVKDVHLESMYTSIKPLIYMVKPYWYFYINVRVNGSNFQAAIDHIQETWIALHPDQPFEYTILDSDFHKLYESDRKLSKGLLMLSMLAVLMSGIGLFGYVKFISQKRVKEIGIRKVLGADLRNLTFTFSKEFMISALITSIISWPISYYLGQMWLDNFSYRVAISPWPFIAALLILILITGLTLMKELLKVVQLDPVETLKYD